MNIEANKAARKADSTLNSIYHQILKDYSTDSAFIKNLKASQQLWIKFRDAEIEMKYPYREGSAYPMCVSTYFTDLTNSRIKILQVWIDGLQEDICTGSVKNKK